MKPAFDWNAKKQQARAMSAEALHYSISDCRKTLEAYPESENAGYYMDEIHTFAEELRRRAGK